MTTPAQQPDERREVVYLLQAISAAGQRYADRAGHRLGLHRTDMHALLAVVNAAREGRTISPGELARAVGLTPSATTTVIDRLERSGHVERAPHPADRRRSVLTPTDSARTDGRAMFMPMARAMDDVVGELDEHELAVVTRFLRRAVQAASTAAEG